MAKTAKNTKFWAFALAPRAEKLPNTDAADELPGEDTTTPAPELAGDEGEGQVVGTLVLHGDIVSSATGADEITSQQFAADLAALGAVSRIDCSLNSRGGDLFTAAAIYNMLKRHPAEIVMHIDGLAASAMSIIACAGDQVLIPRNGMAMIHNPSACVMGDAATMRSSAEDLDKVKSAMLAVYMARTGKTADELAQWMDAETWMTAHDCVAMGFADQVEDKIIPVEIDEAEASGAKWIVNGVTFDFSNTAIRPAAMLGQALRDAEETGVTAQGSRLAMVTAQYRASIANATASLAHEIGEVELRQELWNMRAGWDEYFAELSRDDEPPQGDPLAMFDEGFADYGTLLKGWLTRWLAFDAAEMAEEAQESRAAFVRSITAHAAIARAAASTTDTHPACVAFTAAAKKLGESLQQKMDFRAAMDERYTLDSAYWSALSETLWCEEMTAAAKGAQIKAFTAEFAELMNTWTDKIIGLLQEQETAENATTAMAGTLLSIKALATRTPVANAEAIAAAARLEGITAERARQAELDEMIIPGTGEVAALSQRMVTAARADGTDIGVIAIALQKAQRDPMRRAQMLADRQDDGGDGVKPIAAITGDGIDPKMPTQNAFEAALTKAVSGVK